MALKCHNADYRKFSNEDEARSAINNGNAAPGMYDPATVEKFTQGPVAVTYVRLTYGCVTAGTFGWLWPKA